MGQELQLIEAAKGKLADERKTVSAKKQTKATQRKLEELDIKASNLNAFAELVNNDWSIIGCYVAKDIDSEVGRIADIDGDNSTKVIVQYFDGSEQAVDIADLMIDEKAQRLEPSANTAIKILETHPDKALAGKHIKLSKIIYPGQAELEGVNGLIPAEFWEVSEASDTMSNKTSIVESDMTEIIEATTELDDELLEVTDEALRLKNVVTKTLDGFLFEVGVTDDTLYVGRLHQELPPFLRKQGEGEYELLMQTPPLLRFHGARSMIVREFHRRTEKLKAGDKINFNPWFLAFDDVNKEVYHPDNIEEDTSDIEEDLNAGKPIRQRLGIADDGRIYAGYRRALAALRTNTESVPIEVQHFATEADFVDALLDANKQREKSPEQKAREIMARHKYCSEEARQRQLQQLTQNRGKAEETTGESGTAWEKAAKDSGVSGKTASKQAKIMQFADHFPDKALARKVLNVFNMDDKKTETCLELIKLKPETAHKVADLILSGEAKSVPKALAKVGINTTPAQPKPKGVHLPAPGTVPVNVEQTEQVAQVTEHPRLPEWLMRLVYNTLGEIDIDLNADSSLYVNAAHHMTAVSPELDALRSEWQLPNKTGAVKVFANLYGADLRDWTASAEPQWLKGNINEGLLIVHHLDNKSRAILKRISAASAVILRPVDLTLRDKPYRQVDMTVYYLGTDWRKFFDVFDVHADVRIARWAFDKSYAPQVNLTSLGGTTWSGNGNAATASYGDYRLSVIKSVDGTYFAEINGERIAENLPDESTAKTLAISSADERLHTAVA